MLLLIDNYDSFTWNLFQYFSLTGVDVRVVRNDAITLEEMCRLPLTHLVISPGPCTPDQSGISMAAIRHFAGKIPILGVCLGHQAIVSVFGGKVVRARQPIHGKTSAIIHRGIGVFRRLNNPLTVTRYHSLIAEQASLPECLEITAWTEVNGEPDEIMAIRHKTLPVEGVQFHPESILSEQGVELLKNFVTQAG
ncbi:MULTISPECIES: anthranilate synthase component II [Tatumella]|uniref:Para-aminobenzoate synthase, amidotransferase component n=2 Tax=Tatumella ptyseos TaxID=82987 RepID=A0A085JP36_9GAMM|nr:MULTISPECIES: aminodeoxychorismate/anthranilate synthase component II [Tatumella]KFD22232.1 para-aminobenzoate synthase, amidotransferase component [Tatumella ptyseos ATCC 33301]SQK71691.1 Anthranilate synthase component II [Tatumella ptyseos]